MERMKRDSAIVALLALGGCTIARPLVDREMADAPRAACASVNGGHQLPMPAGAAAPPQCFVLAEQLDDGRRQAWSGGALRPGRTLIAIHQPGAKDCGGRFTHLTVTGGSAGRGEIELATWDPAARPGHMRRHRWQSAFARRTLGLASIDHPTMAAAGARIRVLDGSFDPANICFKSY